MTQTIYRLWGVFVVVCTLVLFTSTTSPVSAQKTEKLVKGTYVEGEMIVKYKADLTPQQLTLAIAERKEKKESFLGGVRLFFDNLKYSLKNKETPETHFSRIQSVDENIGVIEKARISINEADNPDRNIFLVKTDKSKSVDEMIKTYEKLSEVEYAEPNYIFTTQPL